MGLCLPTWFTEQPTDTDTGTLQGHCVRALQPVTLREDFVSKTDTLNHETSMLQAPRLHF